MPGNIRWTARDRRFMEAHADRGSRWIARKLGRTPGAVRKKASKLGIPLGSDMPEPYTCPECGRMLPERPRGGTCRLCALTASRDRARAAAEEAERRLEEDRSRVKALERDRQRWYSAASRARAEAQRLEAEEMLGSSTAADIAATIRADSVNFVTSLGTGRGDRAAGSSHTGRAPGWWNLDGGCGRG